MPLALGSLGDYGVQRCHIRDSEDYGYVKGPRESRAGVVWYKLQILAVCATGAVEQHKAGTSSSSFGALAPGSLLLLELSRFSQRRSCRGSSWELSTSWSIHSGTCKKEGRGLRVRSNFSWFLGSVVLDQ